MKWISRLYIFFLGIILTITTGFGIAAFYPQPSMPQYPSSGVTTPLPQSCNATPKEQQSPECQALLQKQQAAQNADDQKRQQYDQQMRDFQNTNAGYTRTAIFFGIVIGAFFAVLGIGFIKRSKLTATGLMLAAVLTAILTRIVIGLASLGAAVTQTSRADVVSYIEFFILLLLSGAVIFVGLSNLKDEEPLHQPQK